MALSQSLKSLELSFIFLAVMVPFFVQTQWRRPRYHPGDGLQIVYATLHPVSLDQVN